MSPDPLDPTDPDAEAGTAQSGAIPPAEPIGPPPGGARSPQQPPSQPRRLVRRREGRMLAGVAGGIADHLNVDPLLIRIAFVVLVFLGGSGVLLYLAGWLLIPEPDGTTVLDRGALRRFRERHPGWSVAAAVVVLVVGVGLLADTLGIAHAGLVGGLGLVAVGVLLLVEESWHPLGWAVPAAGPSTLPVPAPTAPAPPVPPPSPSPANMASYAEYAAPPLAPAAPEFGEAAAAAWAPVAPQPATQAPAASRRRPRSLLGALTVAAALLAVGTGALLDDLGAVSMSVASALAVALVVVGAGLLVGTWLGRSRALIVLGLALIPFAVAAALVPEPLDAGAGDRTVVPQALGDVSGDYRLTAGHLTVDLSRVALGGAARTVTVQVAVGKVDVVLPLGVEVVIDGHVGGGELRLLGHVDSGVDIDSHVTDAGTPGAGALHLDVRSGFGQVDVVRAAPGA